MSGNACGTPGGEGRLGVVGLTLLVFQELEGVAFSIHPRHGLSLSPLPLTFHSLFPSLPSSSVAAAVNTVLGALKGSLLIFPLYLHRKKSDLSGEV